MIVIGVDVHKQSLTAIAVDEAGRALAESTAPTACELLAWASSLPGERSWAVEDCRQLTRALERALLEAGESLVRVPPKLMAPQRRAGRARGKSDPIDALAVARAALREPRLDHPRPGEQRLRELKLLVDHRDDLIDERRRAQQRLRWHLQRARVGAGGPARCARPRRLARPIGPPPRRPRAVSPGADRARAGRPLPRPHTDDPRPRARAADSGRSNRASALGATRLWRRQRRQAARRDRPDRALRDRRPACPPRRRRTTRSQLRQTSTPPARPRRQPPTQLRPTPDRDHAGARPRTRSRLPRAQAGRGKEPTRSTPLPQTTARAHCLHHPQKRGLIDIGATLAHPAAHCLADGSDHP